MFRQVSINPTFQHTGKWYDYFAGDSLDVTNVTDPISLEPGEYRIYTDVKLAKPELGLGTNESYIQNKLNPLVYPNPSGGEFNISFILTEPSEVELNIVDLQGRVLSNLFSGKLETGEQTYKWNPADQIKGKRTRGMYFAELIVNGQKQVTKLVVN